MYFFMRMLELILVGLMTAWWLNNISEALKHTHRAVRSLDPKQVWLTFIPGFGLVWAFIINTKVSESLAREYRRRGWQSDESRPGFEIGAVAAVVGCIYQLQFFFTLLIPFLSFVCAIILAGVMYRHADRLTAFRERLENEPDPSMHQPQPFYPQQWPQNYPPQYPQNYPQQWPQNYPPQWPQQQVHYPPPTPDNNQQWAPPHQQNN